MPSTPYYTPGCTINTGFQLPVHFIMDSGYNLTENKSRQIYTE